MTREERQYERARLADELRRNPPFDAWLHNLRVVHRALSAGDAKTGKEYLNPVIQDLRSLTENEEVA